jgi:methionyl-tRNA synthetase
MILSAKLYDNGQIYLSKYSGWYAVRDEAYYTEDELATNAAGEKICAATGSPVVWMEEESYFFRLSAWQEPLLEFYKNNPQAIYPKSRFNEVIKFIEGGLQDLSISRTNFPWGVPVPNDANHVMYVWIDALVNYLSALGYPENEADMQAFWPHVEHVMAKEITRFHAVYWPAFLMAAHLKPPKRVIAHGWLTAEGQKMSKSLGNFIVPRVLIDEFGLDQLRYYLMRDFSFGQDGDFSKAQFVQRINSDLANDLGNLAQRVLAFVFKNNDAKLPQLGELLAVDTAYLAQSGTSLLNHVRNLMADYQYHKALDDIWAVIRQGNIYVDEQAPWALKKTDVARMQTVLAVLLETLRRIAILLQPFMPDSMDNMLSLLQVPANARNFEHVSDTIGLNMGATITQPQGVFPRIDKN